MNLKLTRTSAHGRNLFGYLVITDEKDTVFNCITLENSDHKIEEGVYDIFIAHSPKFNRNLVSLKVPERYGIRVHSANFGRELKGCISLGAIKGIDCIRYSKRTVDIFEEVIKDYESKWSKPLKIEIKTIIN